MALGLSAVCCALGYCVGQIDMYWRVLRVLRKYDKHNLEAEEGKA